MPLSPESAATLAAAAPNRFRSLRRLAAVIAGVWVLATGPSVALGAKGRISREQLWSLRPLTTPEVPRFVTTSTNAIDAFVAAACREKGLLPFGPADKRTLLRRVSLDLTGLPPTLEEQEAFLADKAPDAYDRVVDRLLGSEQHGVRYGRHWLDALRYADHDENMPAANGIHLWRDWVVQALNRNLPYDAFVRAQVCGNRAARRLVISHEGHLTRIEPQPEDVFALGFLSRGATSPDDKDQMLAMSAVETISSVFLGMTVGCAKCHDHFYDPILQRDYYAMKALFDPLVLRPVELATSAQLFDQGKRRREFESRRDAVTEAMRKFIAPHHARLYEERVQTLPPEAQAAVRKPWDSRTAAERRLFEDYYPILRVDPVKLRAVMSPGEIQKYDEFLATLAGMKPPESVPSFFAVAEDPKRLQDPSYILTTGDPARPKKSQAVTPGFPFQPDGYEFHDGRREGFADWLTSPANPLFARVAVNRIWQWHFEAGLHPSANDFGALGGEPIHGPILDWLASEFVRQGFDMRWLHRQIVTSDTYRRATSGPSDATDANHRRDPENRWLWRAPLRRLEAEAIRDSMLAVAGALDLSLGGPAYQATGLVDGTSRRTLYLSRGYRSYADAMPDFLQTFDAEDGRAVCARRARTVTAPQALWMMNSELVDTLASRLATWLERASSGSPAVMIELGYRRVLARAPTPSERETAARFLEGGTGRAEDLAWMLFNLDEFIYLR